MKKLISIILIIALSLTTYTPIKAEEKITNKSEQLISIPDNVKVNETPKLPDVINLIVDSSGFYVESLAKSSITATMTDDYGIYKTSKGDLISYTGAETMQLVDRFEFKLTDPKLLDEIRNLNLESEIQKDIIEKASAANELKNDNETVVIFIPKAIKTKSSYTSYFIHNGYKMKETQIYYYNSSSPGFQDVLSGSITKATLGNLTEFGIGLGTFVSYSTLQITIIGASLLSAIADANSVNISSPGGGDYCQALIQTDYSNRKYTYVDWNQDGNYNLVLRTARADVNHVELRGQFYNGSSSYDNYYVYISSNADIYSYDYYDTADKASTLYNSYLDESFYLQIGDHKWHY